MAVNFSDTNDQRTELCASYIHCRSSSRLRGEFVALLGCGRPGPLAADAWCPFKQGIARGAQLEEW